MPLLSEYNVYIFDCDGVILDSNQLKIDAMRSAVSLETSNEKLIDECTDYFKNNFGKSRYHHIDIFVTNILKVPKYSTKSVKERLLEAYSAQCKILYMSAEITEGFMSLITSLEGKKYVASGSEQNELRDVFRARKLDVYFNDILGSPERKTNHVESIIRENKKSKFVMIGDAVSDLEAAKDNLIDFIFYSPLSNVSEKMLSLCKQNQYQVIDSFQGVLDNDE